MAGRLPPRGFYNEGKEYILFNGQTETNTRFGEACTLADADGSGPLILFGVCRRQNWGQGPQGSHPECPMTLKVSHQDLRWQGVGVLSLNGTKLLVTSLPEMTPPMPRYSWFKYLVCIGSFSCQ